MNDFQVNNDTNGRMVKTECSASESSGYQSIVSPMGSWSNMLGGENTAKTPENPGENNINDSKYQ